jgi:hypothetical protein
MIAVQTGTTLPSTIRHNADELELYACAIVCSYDYGEEFNTRMCYVAAADYKSACNALTQLVRHVNMEAFVRTIDDLIEAGSDSYDESVHKPIYDMLVGGFSNKITEEMYGVVTDLNYDEGNTYEAGKVTVIRKATGIAGAKYNVKLQYIPEVCST